MADPAFVATPEPQPQDAGPDDSWMSRLMGAFSPEVLKNMFYVAPRDMIEKAAGPGWVTPNGSGYFGITPENSQGLVGDYYQGMYNLANLPDTVEPLRTVELQRLRQDK